MTSIDEIARITQVQGVVDAEEPEEEESEEAAAPAGQQE
jgi:hypothetical protein